MGAYLTKDLLLYTAFTIDALNTLITFPLFISKGPTWALQQITSQTQQDQMTASSSSLKDETNRPSFQALWDLFLVAYEGYFGFTMSTMVCFYQLPESMPIFGYTLFALYGYKWYAMKKSKGLGRGRGQERGGSDHDKDDKEKMYQSKLKSIQFFFLPCYGGYCALHLWEWMGRRRRERE